MNEGIYMAQILDGKTAAQSIKEQLKNELKLPLQLAIIHQNDDASNAYLKGRKKIAQELQINIKEILIDEHITQKELIELIHQLNHDSTIDGIMVDRPLPKKLDENKILSSISPIKDVDGYTYTNLGKLMSNQKTLHACTPAAAIALLDFYHIPIETKNIVIIGRSINVGKPLAIMLLNRNATVTIAHSKTKELAKITKKADIIFTCIGKAKMITKEYISKKTVIIDIGINFDEQHHLCGDVHPECYSILKAYSPVPGGVGVLTNLMLMKNLYLAHQEILKNENTLSTQ